MAQMEDTRRTSSDILNAQRPQNSPRSKSYRAQTSPTFQQLLQGEASSWSSNSSPKQKKNHDHEDDGNHHNKKSVLSKVKEKAKKLRNSFGKKHRDENELRGPNNIPPWGVGLEDEEEEDPEYLGAPMYESELAPEEYKQAARLRPREVNTAPSEKHVVTSSVKPSKEQLPSSAKIIVEAQSENQAPPPAYTDPVPRNQAAENADISQVHDLPPNTASKFSNLTISTPERTEAGGYNTSGITKLDEASEGIENSRGNSQTWDKGVSVKEYLMQKFEPGEDERALSQVITETISPRRHKMREAMNSLLGGEEPSQSSGKISNSGNDISTASSNTNPDAGVSFSDALSYPNSNIGADSSTVTSKSNLSNASKPKTNIVSKTAASDSNHSSLSNTSNPSNLNQSFISTAASHKNNNLGSNSVTSSHQNPNLKSKISTRQSTPNQTSILHSASKMNSSPGVHASAANQTKVPVSAANQARVPVNNNAKATQVSASAANQSRGPAYANTNATRTRASSNSHEVVENENHGRILQPN